VRRGVKLKGDWMPVITEESMEGQDLCGEDHGASISIILDHSEPGQGPGRSHMVCIHASPKMITEWLE
jgi:hypothetical protein